MRHRSALSLITKGDPPIYMHYAMTPRAPVPEATPDNPRAAISFQGHHVVFGLALGREMDKLAIEAHLDYPGAKISLPLCRAVLDSEAQATIRPVTVPAFGRRPVSYRSNG